VVELPVGEPTTFALRAAPSLARNLLSHPDVRKQFSAVRDTLRGALPDQAERVAGRVGEDPEAFAAGVQAGCA
jgi:hypothetical protein